MPFLFPFINCVLYLSLSAVCCLVMVTSALGEMKLEE